MRSFGIQVTRFFPRLDSFPLCWIVACRTTPPPASHPPGVVPSLRERVYVDFLFQSFPTTSLPSLPKY